MKAIVYSRYGSPEEREYTNVKRPTPKKGEVLVRIKAAAANRADRYLLEGKPYLFRLAFGLMRPKYPILGADIAGVVEDLGEGVTDFNLGDTVYGDLSGVGNGGYAEFVAVPTEVLAPMPADLSFVKAAGVPMAGVTALQALRDRGELKLGDKVLIYGASGGVGNFAVQLANILGAEVTAVCSSKNVETALNSGAHHVVDYKTTNVLDLNRTYDLILACNGYLPLKDYKRLLKTNGTCVTIGGSLKQIFQTMFLGAFISVGNKKRFRVLSAKPSTDDLLFLSQKIEEGTLDPFIERQYALENVPLLFKDRMQGSAKGKLVVTMG